MEHFPCVRACVGARGRDFCSKNKSADRHGAVPARPRTLKQSINSITEMKRTYLILATALVLALSSCGQEKAAGEASVDLFPDTWVATDALGRTMPLIDSVGPLKTDHQRTVGIFYITWHTQHAYDAGDIPMSARSSRRTLPQGSGTTIPFGNTVAAIGANPRWATSSARTNG